jgi:hypothetical protein
LKGKYRKHQYKYHFNKWGWHKNDSRENQIRISKHVRSRVEAGKSSNVTHKGKQVDLRKVGRVLREEKRAIANALELKKLSNQTTMIDEPVLPFPNSL